MASVSSVDRLRPAGVVLAVVAQSYAGPRRQRLNGRGKVQVLGLAQERNSVAPHLAAEAVVDAQLPVYRERGCVFTVERAQSDPLGAHPAQGNAFGDEGHEVGGRPDPFYVLGNDPHRQRLKRAGDRSGARPGATRPGATGPPRPVGR